VISGVHEEVLVLVLNRVISHTSARPRASVPYTLETQQRNSTILLKIEPGLGPDSIGGSGQIWTDLPSLVSFPLHSTQARL
jgi:hypothetical protein